ncbi:MAG: ribose-phosphate pyrophosphokinase, partial [Clostridiales bacterium]|nr:ribose-phosphate pyrophosphokinase [Clostridiales bacterium]
MANIERRRFSDIDFVGDLGLIALKSCKDFGSKVDANIKRLRHKANIPYPDTYMIDAEEIRFTNGEGKIILNETVRGKDIYLICDIGNYSLTYSLYGHTNSMGPDEHFQDIKRAVSAIGGKAARINVIMPMLYASRQDRNKGRESLDCALALRELEALGVRDVITFDVHNPSVQNAVPLMSFENLYATYEIVKNFIKDEGEIVSDKENFLIISPDLGGMERAIYYSTVMDIDVGMFYKRRDYSRIVDGRNPVVMHEYLGRDVAGKNVIIIDDMISSGDSISEVIHDLKRRRAAKIFVATTFALFTRGIAAYQELYDKGMLTKVYSTNLTYVPDEIIAEPWFKHVDMSPFAAEIVNNLNMNRSIEPLLDATGRLEKHLS